MTALVNNDAPWITTTTTETISEIGPMHTWAPGPLLGRVIGEYQLVLVCACGSIWIVDPLDTQYHGHREFYDPDAHRAEEPTA